MRERLEDELEEKKEDETIDFLIDVASCLQLVIIRFHKEINNQLRSLELHLTRRFKYLQILFCCKYLFLVVFNIFLFSLS